MAPMWTMALMSKMWSVKVLGLGVLVVPLSLELLGWIFKRCRSKRILNEVLFFPSELACVEHVFTPTGVPPCVCPLPHGLETSFSRLLRHILSASSSLDLCVFSFSNPHLSRAVLLLHGRGVNVRVLTDKDYAEITGSKIGALRMAGICVRSDSTYVHMHHKFAVLDGRRLVTGSLNWTMGAVQSNKENVLVTDEPGLVRPFLDEFLELWARNDPVQLRQNQQNHWNHRNHRNQ
ncbi:mitochondrial cardiolipin hydrolase [Cololabis saira]|uniref:mitochondrial cardiolipin hydrolase n=1 Tax=Cololabis saira TaxID=129043 RepID=UPI002AD2C5ED|nr:mitochondrial cardiolipin hydrolase [Cololabis saira]XP_061587440.1 mitochondrial cardiolipin hydrolase [Cololabis saira]XP_061587502.1 mitochondrial cardiolipin hydrolase [Cololabis saira]